MTTTMMKKIEEAKKMVSTLCEEDGLFIPSQYDKWHAMWQWYYHGEGETPTWATLKKYASEIGLVAVDCTCAWHSDGSLLAELCGIAEGTIFHYTAYRFE